MLPFNVDSSRASKCRKFAYDRDGGDCQSKRANEYRHGNQVKDLGGALGVEAEQWYYSVGFRPEPGDRAVARGLWVVDCGHPDWHAELHPASLLVSSYLQNSDFAPMLGTTWNRPLRLTSNWRALTGGVPVVVTKIVASPVFAEGSLEVDVWPPARSNACARLVIAREDERPNPLWSGVQFTENLLPADGNPNHLHLTITRTPFNLDFGGDGDVQNPDEHLNFSPTWRGGLRTHARRAAPARAARTARTGSRPTARHRDGRLFRCP